MPKTNPNVRLVSQLDDRHGIYFDNEKRSLKFTSFAIVPIFKKGANRYYEGYESDILFRKRDFNGSRVIRPRQNRPGFYFYMTDIRRGAVNANRRVIRDYSNAPTTWSSGIPPMYNETFSHVFQDCFGLTLREAWFQTYPQANYFPYENDTFAYIPPLITLPLMESDPKVAAGMIFGGYNKEIMKRYAGFVQNGDGVGLEIAYLGRLMGIDPQNIARLLVDFDGTNFRSLDFSADKRTTIRFARRFGILSDHRKNRMLESIANSADPDEYLQGYHLRDTVRMINGPMVNEAEIENAILNSRTIEELHDHMIDVYGGPMYQTRGRVEPKSFDFYDDLSFLEDVKIDGKSILLPKSQEDLMKWGRRMNNCIGSYAYYVNPSNFVFALVDENGHMTHNAEWRAGSIVQCSLNSNRRETVVFIDRLERKINKAMEKNNE